jgi:hypothetical protein
MRIPSPKKIKIIPIKIPRDWGFAKITNKKAPIKSGILRIFLCQDVLLSSITPSLSYRPGRDGTFLLFKINHETESYKRGDLSLFLRREFKKNVPPLFKQLTFVVRQ